MEPLIGKTKDEYDAIVSSLGEAPYRARQIEKSVNAGRLIDEMSELSLKLRERLKEKLRERLRLQRQCWRKNIL